MKLFAQLIVVVMVALIGALVGTVFEDREWRAALNISNDVSVREVSEMFLIPPPPMDDWPPKKNPDWVAMEPTGPIVEHPEAAAERAVNPNGTCGRCQRPWKTREQPGVRTHSTPTSIDSACHPLCVTCWRLLTPEERLPYYFDLWHKWDEWADNSTPWEVMKAACLYENGKGYELEEDLPPELLQAWNDAGGLEEGGITLSIPVVTSDSSGVIALP